MTARQHRFVGNSRAPGSLVLCGAFETCAERLVIEVED
jgi:hypothetical protein